MYAKAGLVFSLPRAPNDVAKRQTLRQFVIGHDICRAWVVRSDPDCGCVYQCAPHPHLTTTQRDGFTPYDEERTCKSGKVPCYLTNQLCSRLIQVVSVHIAATVITNSDRPRSQARRSVEGVSPPRAHAIAEWQNPKSTCAPRRALSLGAKMSRPLLRADITPHHDWVVHPMIQFRRDSKPRSARITADGIKRSHGMYEAVFCRLRTETSPIDSQGDSRGWAFRPDCVIRAGAADYLESSRPALLALIHQPIAELRYATVHSWSRWFVYASLAEFFYR
ncbi:hypothetical protein HYPSUDRAFT_58271 [Hypholoma sublateritium FD-334 SS-4]|uniref:Uncharacterized protein n=1 Tax=Hypholoma sublateritium (strain FD-334 SS-4) TaxID=945553 RepID=A0A0D2P7G5_HYPSF|nr:hypothetical protein HYPSUDRAFT_58271 [Hypholoma sublateritium FD-334 SS-4]